ncbi:MAG: hypothetical protein IKE60_34385 [Reyranella sp.]|uniref:NrdR family transcriptional regulator n=1 Tax=Reyranella sp. TaxID=1929291 RepID=UPI0025F3DEA3|nr:hypothetical protein [Reyranella sp.]MBR2819809.1 hypothetical protein [Reyranella sp.]
MNGAPKLPGVLCPECGSATRVYNSRPNRLSTAGGIRRRRKCVDCQHRFSTDEEPVPETLEGAAAYAHAAELGRLYLTLGHADRSALLRLARAFRPASPAERSSHVPSEEAPHVIASV